MFGDAVVYISRVVVKMNNVLPVHVRLELWVSWKILGPTIHATGIQRSQGACVALPEAFTCAPVDQRGDGKGTVVLLMAEILLTS